MQSSFATNATINQEMIDEAKALIGKDLIVYQYNEFASYDTIRHYAYGIGDDNPLWADEAYAAKTKHKTQLAPPLFLISIMPSSISPGFPGLQPLKVGDKWTWYRPIRQGDRIKAKAKLTGVEEIEGRAGGHMIREYGQIEYRTVEGELLASVDTTHIRVMRPGSEGGGLKYAPQEPREYTVEELKKIEDDIFAEELRGAVPRYWEDVEVGDELTPVVKGPLDQITMTCYYAGAIGTPGYRASELRWKQWRLANEHPEQMPGNYPADYFQERVLPSLGHQNADVAHDIGMPGAYDNGHQRMAWMVHCVTNWMGDDGFLRELDIQLRKPNIFGNTTWCSGRVTEKFVDADAHCVRVELSGINQDQEVNTTATAVIVLPSRADTAE